MPAFDPDKFVNRERELAYITDKVTRLARGDPFAPHERVVHVVGPSGIGKSCLLEKCYELLDNEADCVPILIQLETIIGSEFLDTFLATIYKKFCSHPKISINETPKGLSKSLEQYAFILIRTINLNLGNKVLVIFIDEINVPETKELHSIEKNLSGLLHGNGHVVLITAGRSHPILNDFALRPSATNTFLLSAFDEKATGEQLEKLRPGSASVASQVLELGAGVPGNNTKLAAYVVGEPPNIPNELEAVQSLLADVKRGIDEKFHPVLEAICILQDLMPDDVVPLLESHPALVKKWDDNLFRESFLELRQVQIGPGGLINWDREKKGWVVDEPTRLLFERELRLRDEDLWRKLHTTAYAMYEKWGKDYNSQLYKDKAAYHQQCLQAAGYDLGNEGEP